MPSRVRVECTAARRHPRSNPVVDLIKQPSARARCQPNRSRKLAKPDKPIHARTGQAGARAYISYPQYSRNHCRVSEWTISVRSVHDMQMRFVNNPDKNRSTRYVRRSMPTLRLRLLLKHPAGTTAFLPRARGRPPKYVPLLVAMDEICRRGIEPLKDEDEGFVRPLSLKRGRRSAKMKQTASEALITELARDWCLSEASIEEYLENDDRFYYPRALALMNKVLRLPLSPPLKVDEVRYAISEHHPRNRKGKPQLAADGLEFDLHPWIYQPHQRSQLSRKRRPPRS